MAEVERTYRDTHVNASVARYVDPQRPVRAFLGELPIEVKPEALLAFLERQLLFIHTAANDPKSKTIRMAFKAAARVAMDFIVMPRAKRGELPMPNAEACKADILSYTLFYWSDLILMGLQQQTWDLHYVESPDGIITITGVAPTVADAELHAEPAETAGAGAETDSATGQESGSGLVGTLVPGGYNGIGQDDVREGAGSTAQETVA